MTLRKILPAIIGLCLFAISTLAQAQQIKPTPSVRGAIIDSLSAVMSSNYIFPDTGAKMMSNIRQQSATGKYDKIVNPADFAQRLTTDLRAVYNDKHLAVTYDPSLKKSTENSSYILLAAKQMQLEKEARQQNYGFSKIEILNGNIGYVAINSFFDLNDKSRLAANSAFDFLRNVNVVVIDLRLNGGGQAEMAHYITSLFFKDATHINDFYVRRANKVFQNWTAPGELSTVCYSIPIYVLVSAYTASAAEEFAYDLQSRHRAIIVGEVTQGAAHPMEVIDIGNGFSANIPFARPINPITKTDWETVGLKPDLAVKHDNALDASIKNFFQHQVKSSDSLTAKNARWLYFVYKAKRNPCKLSVADIKTFTGDYNGHKIRLQNGHLVYTSPTGYSATLIPIAKTTFLLGSDFDNREMIFHKNKKGRPNRMYLNFDGNLSAMFVRD